MKSISLSIFSISFEKNNEEIMLDCVTQNKMNEDIIKFFNFLSDDIDNDESKQKVLSVVDYKPEEMIDQESNEILYDYIFGKFTSGEYGTESEIINTITRENIFHKKSEHAEVLPFYFTFGIPRSNSTKLLLILQGIGNHKIKTVFYESFKRYFKKVLLIERNISISLKPLIPVDFIDSLVEEGKFNRIRLINYMIPTDLSDKFGVNGGVAEQQSGYVETVIVRGKNSTSQTVKIAAKKIFEAYKTRSSILAFKEEMDYDEYKVELEIGGKNRVISASNFQNLSFSIDISNDVILNSGGHPTENSILPLMKEHLADFYDLLGILG